MTPSRPSWLVGWLGWGPSTASAGGFLREPVEDALTHLHLVLACQPRHWSTSHQEVQTCSMTPGAWEAPVRGRHGASPYPSSVTWRTPRPEAVSDLEDSPYKALPSSSSLSLPNGQPWSALGRVPLLSSGLRLSLAAAALSVALQKGYIT